MDSVFSVCPQIGCGRIWSLLSEDGELLQAAGDKRRFFVDDRSQMVEGVLGLTDPDVQASVQDEESFRSGLSAGLTFCAGKVELCTSRMGPLANA